jgi:hypothetical protein
MNSPNCFFRSAATMTGAIATTYPVLHAARIGTTRRQVRNRMPRAHEKALFHEDMPVRLLWRN